MEPPQKLMKTSELSLFPYSCRIQRELMPIFSGAVGWICRELLSKARCAVCALAIPIQSRRQGGMVRSQSNPWPGNIPINQIGE